MTRNENKLVPDCIPEKLVEKGMIYHFSAAQLRPQSIAWKNEQAIEVIEILAKNRYAILGGDVLKISEGKIRYSGDFWDLADADVIFWDEYIEDTREKSISFIEVNAQGKEDSIAYAIFYINENDHKEQVRNFGSIKYR